MGWAIVLLTLLESVDDHANRTARRELEAAEKAEVPDGAEGGILAATRKPETTNQEELRQKAFEKLWGLNAKWAEQALRDAVAFAKESEPRDRETIKIALHPETSSKRQDKSDGNIAAGFAQAWQSLKNRGWKAEVMSTGIQLGKTRYEYEGKQVKCICIVLLNRLSSLIWFCTVFDLVLVLRGGFEGCGHSSPRSGVYVQQCIRAASDQRRQVS